MKLLGLALVLLTSQLGCAYRQAGDDRFLRPDDALLTPPESTSGWSREKKARVLTAGVLGSVAAYGLAFWDYGAHDFKTADEGWLGANTASGGADKFGHAYSTYLGTMILSNAYEKIGYDTATAIKYGALTTWAAFVLIEIGDGFSSHGFSGEDLVVDAAGILMGYYRKRYPRFRELVDYRIEYWPSPATRKAGRSDIATDYSGFKYLLAFKLAGIRGLEDSPLQYTELHLGYYTRGYLTSDPEFFDGTRRVGYVGVGFNLARLFRKKGYEKTATFLDYFQIPYTYVDGRHNFD